MIQRQKERKIVEEQCELLKKSLANLLQKTFQLLEVRPTWFRHKRLKTNEKKNLLKRASNERFSKNSLINKSPSHSGFLLAQRV